MAEQRPLGAVHAAALVVASMVGTGIFTTTGVLLTSLSSAAIVLAAWVALLAAVTVLHMADVRLGGRVQAGLAALVVAVIVLFVVAALATGRLSGTNLTMAVPGAGPAHAGGAIASAGAFAIGLVQV